MCEGQMHFSHLKAISVALYKVLEKTFFTDCFIPLNQKGFEYLKIISYPVFSTFDQQNCKYFNNHQFRQREKLQFWGGQWHFLSWPWQAHLFHLSFVLCKQMERIEIQQVEMYWLSFSNFISNVMECLMNSLKLSSLSFSCLTYFSANLTFINTHTKWNFNVIFAWEILAGL